MKFTLQFPIIISVVWLTYFFISTVTGLIFLHYYTIIHISSLIFAFGAGLLAWKKLNTNEVNSLANIILGALILGGTGVAIGILGAPRGSEQAIFGVFLGPPGVILGAILGFHLGKNNSKAWNRLLWICAIGSFALFVSKKTYNLSYESKYSSVINAPSDLQKREDTLKYLRVSSLSDNDLEQLKRFENLYGLYFTSYKAKLTDAGLKNLLELNLPNLGALTLNQCNRITDEGMKYVAAIHTLNFIGLADCKHLTNAGLAMLADSDSIDTIDLRGCVSITDDGLDYLSKMPSLKRVRLGGCSNISTHGIEELRKSRPEISVEKHDDEWAERYE